MAIEIEVLDKDVQRAIDKTLKQVDDLTIPFTLMTQSWFKQNRAISSLTSPGKYADLSPNYKPQKQRKWGMVYPILGASGRLLSSITVNGPESVNLILNKLTLILGTKVPYGVFHQFGTKRMPARPFILLGPEQVAPDGINRRKEDWIKILNDFVVQMSKKNLEQV